MPLITSNLAASKAKLRESPWWEQGILGVVNGGGKIADGFTGLLEKAGQLAVERSNNKSKPKPWYDSLTAGSDPFTGHVLDKVGELAKSYLPTVAATRADIQKTQDRLEPQLNDVGRASSFVSKAIPDLALSGPGAGLKVANTAQNILRSYGEGELDSGLASLLFKGNKLSSNLQGQSSQEVVNYIKSLFQ